MTVNPERIRQRLQDFDLPGLFIEELGWDYHRETLRNIALDGHEFDIQAIAEKRGYVAFRCGPWPDGQIPNDQDRKKIERQVRKQKHEHAIIFTDAGETELVWQWVKYQHGKPPQSREQRFQRGQTGQALVEKLREIAFSLDEEHLLTLTDVASRFGSGFDVDRVTKKFYDLGRQTQLEEAGFEVVQVGVRIAAEAQLCPSGFLPEGELRPQGAPGADIRDLQLCAAQRLGARCDGRHQPHPAPHHHRGGSAPSTGRAALMVAD
ncbi:hypothetical protein BH23CHL2_BH23CHL2_12460 [soil metagenome]